MREALLEILKQKAFRQGLFKLSSGKTSDFYINCKKALTGEALVLIGHCFYDIMKTERGIHGVGGLTMGADPLATATAMWATLFASNPITPFYVRKEPKSHGSEDWIEGHELMERAPVAIVEDVITTGASTIKAIERARICGLNPLYVIALVDRQEDNGRQNIEALDLPVHALFTRKDFIP